MSYYTWYTLGQIKGKEEDFHKLLKEIKDETGYDLEVGVDAKWYNHIDDMKKFTKGFPNLVVELAGDGEDSDDNWNLRFCNGEMEEYPFVKFAVGDVTHEKIVEDVLWKPTIHLRDFLRKIGCPVEDDLPFDAIYEKVKTKLKTPSFERRQQALLKECFDEIEGIIKESGQTNIVLANPVRVLVCNGPYDNSYVETVSAVSYDGICVSFISKDDDESVRFSAFVDQSDIFEIYDELKYTLTAKS